jgi:hypothetical protein
MDDTAVIQADARSALTNYVALLIDLEQNLARILDRDAEALRILMAEPALPMARERAEHRFWVGQRQRKVGTVVYCPRIWTRQDERRLNLQRGLVGGAWPRCRVVRYIDQVAPRIKLLLRHAITEARDDGTVAAIGSKLDAADKAVNDAFSAARSISQDDGRESAFAMACLALREVVSELIHWTKPSLENARPAATSRLVNREEDKLLWLAKAMLRVQENPGWSDAEIAESVGKHKSTLSRNQVYQAAAAMARGNKEDRRHGHITVDPETNRLDVEAHAEDPEEPDWDE